MTNKIISILLSCERSSFQKNAILSPKRGQEAGCEAPAILSPKGQEASCEASAKQDSAKPIVKPPRSKLLITVRTRRRNTSGGQSVRGYTASSQAGLPPLGG